MRIEEEVFSHHSIVPEKLFAYGFSSEGDRLVYSRELPDDGMKIIVEYDGTINGRIIDQSLNDEYTAFRVEGATGYSAQIRQKYIGLLTEIRNYCCKNQCFKTPQARGSAIISLRLTAVRRSSCGPTSPAMQPSDRWVRRNGLPSWGACR